jgi:hypothetical protein
VANRAVARARDLVEPLPVARERLRRRLRAIGPPRPGWTFVRSDVRACYPSIDIPVVAAALPPGEPRDLLVRTLGRIHARGGRGLPVGPPASAIVANAVLGAADRAIAGAGAWHLRWVDDVVIVADGRRQARSAFDAWRSALGSAGLEANPAKTAFDLDPGALPGWTGSALGAARDVR